MPVPESVTLETNMGDIQLELYWDHAPKACFFVPKFCFWLTAAFFQTCENFAQLAKRGYYNGVVFHRIVAVCWPRTGGVGLCLPFPCEGLYGSRR
jgi:peptidyl-prolyl cis-trans isomerase-like 1